SLSYVRRLKRFSSVTATMLASGSTATSANTGNRSRTLRIGASFTPTCQKKASAAEPGRRKANTMRNGRNRVRIGDGIMTSQLTDDQRGVLALALCQPLSLHPVVGAIEQGQIVVINVLVADERTRELLWL